MSQRNFSRAPSSSHLDAEENIAELVVEVEILSARVTSEDAAVDDDNDSRRRLCSLLSRLHSPSVVRRVGFPHLESKILCKTCPPTRDYFESLGRDLRRLREDVLGEAVGCLETLAGLMSFVLEELKELDPAEALRSFESLPATGVYVIKSCYKICADIGLSASPEALNSVAKSLVAAAQDLSAKVGAVYELVQVVDLSAYSRFVGDSLAAFEAAVEVTRPLDVKMFSKLTKIAVKFLLQQQVLAEELGHLNRFLEYYIENLLSSLSTIPIPLECDSQPSQDRAFVDESRICQFLARVASQVVESVHSLLARHFVDRIVRFLDRVNALLILGYDTDDGNVDGSQLQRPFIPPVITRELSRILQPSIYHISKSSLHDEPFQRSLLDIAGIDGNGNDEQRRDVNAHSSRAIGRLISLIYVTEQLVSLKSEETTALWLEPLTTDEPNLVDAIFRCVEECEAELLLPVKMPGPMHGGMAQRDVSLYSILLFRLNHLLFNCPASAFDVIEPVLLRWVLSDSPLTSSLATDALCFIVRVAPPGVGWSLTLAMAELFQRVVVRGNEVAGVGFTISNVASDGLKKLLTRLFRFLSSSQRAEFRRRFPVNQHPDLWCLFLLKEDSLAAKDLFEELTEEWNSASSDIGKFYVALRRCRRALFRLNGLQINHFQKFVLKLAQTSLKLIGGQMEFIPSLATETLYLLANALQVSGNFPTSNESVVTDDQLFVVLQWCAERIDSTSSASFAHSVSCLLLTLSSRTFDGALHDPLLTQYLKLLTRLVKGRKAVSNEENGLPRLDGSDEVDPRVRLNCLRALERRAKASTDAHFVAAYLMNDPAVREVARPFLERVRKDEGERDALKRLRKEVGAVKRAPRRLGADNGGNFEGKGSMEDSDDDDRVKIGIDVKTDEPPTDRDKGETIESMNFDLMSDDDDELFSQVLSQQSELGGDGSGDGVGVELVQVQSGSENSQKSDSWIFESKATTTSTTAVTAAGDDVRTRDISTTTKAQRAIPHEDDETIVAPTSPSSSHLPSSDSRAAVVVADSEEDAAAFQQLVDDALKEVHEDVKMLASYCANLKALLPEGKLAQSTIVGIQSCLDDLKACL